VVLKLKVFELIWGRQVSSGQEKEPGEYPCDTVVRALVQILLNVLVVGYIREDT